MTQCYEGGYTNEFDDIYERASKEGKLDEIFEAKDVNLNLPFQVASKHGNSEALAWIFQKWKDNGLEIDINKRTSEGFTALMSACVRGYNSGSEESAAKL